MPESPARADEKPPSRRLKRYWKIAVLANIKDDDHPKPEGVPPDAFADFDHIETIDSIRAALETDGHETVFIQADADLLIDADEIAEGYRLLCSALVYADSVLEIGIC